MAAQDCIAENSVTEATQETIRRLKVSYASRYPDYTRIPAVIMKGKWLAAAGFDTGTEVDVRVMKGCIVLMAKEAPEEKPQDEAEPELMQALRRVEKLSKRKQKQVWAFIDGVSGSCRRG
ncbi:endoribonuclease SymE [Chimaeribacter arupi]|uniref:endoribonuclease SymE n=1 Tax=Chimaeribacter arupi TaxID=2060066 RepID=UPI000C7BB1FC|nr:endoribonuclease SymE [Chimaeribacter arupi]PLR32484.1 endoribonuclease SymE [Chimaeribacter arupi]